MSLLFPLLLVHLGSAVALDSTGCITRDVFGTYTSPETGQELPVYRYTLTSGQVTVQVMEYGATVTSITAPDSQGNTEDILLGYDTLEGFFGADNPYFGATVGRVANRVGNAQFILDDVTYTLFRNIGNHSLHGGLRGFDKRLWSSEMTDGRVLMHYSSADGEEGYPGRVTVTVAYSLTSDGTLVIEYKALSSRRTPINLTNHAYFNLAGHAAGPEALYNHTVSILSEQVTETSDEFIPTGRLTQVRGTPYDLRKPRNLGEAISRTAIDGFDFNYVLPQDKDGVVVARVEDPVSGRTLEVETSQPGLQFYTGNSISNIRGKGGSLYTRHSAFCLETQNFPDAVNHPREFPNAVYGPFDVYRQETRYKFGVSSPPGYYS